MRKLTIVFLFLLSFLAINAAVQVKAKKVFIERSNQGFFISENSVGPEDNTLSESLVMSVKLNYDSFNHQGQSDELDHDEFINASREYHYNINNEYVQELGIDANDVFISEYTPFVFYHFSGEAMTNLFDFATTVAEAPFIQSIYLYESDLYEAKPLVDGNDVQFVDEPYVMPASYDPRDYIGYDNFPAGTPYTGQGIKIGILDTGIFDPYHSNFSENYAEITYDTYTSNNNSPSAQHPTWVASVLGGKGGIANKASLYYVDANSSSGLTAIEKLVNKNVHVINMSIINTDYYNNGNYDSSIEAYIDYIYVSTRITLIAGTGNSLNVKGSGGYIGLPALASNVIAVGSLDELGTQSRFSSYNNKNDINSKPSLVALGDGRAIYGFGYKDGTSFSAPAVTGAVALFYQKYSVKDMPATLAALTATADNEKASKAVETIQLRTYNKSTNTYTPIDEYIQVTNNIKASGLYERSGAGALDITRLLDYNRSFISGPLNITSTDYFTMNSSVYIPAHTTFTASLVWQRNATKKVEFIFITKYIKGPLADLDLVLTNSSDVEVARCYSVGGNTEIIRFRTTMSGTYKLKFKPYTDYQDLKYVNYAYTIK